MHLSAAVQYFRLSLHARKYEARLINLRIALEALFQSTEGGSLINRISLYVSTIMALNYVKDVSRAIPVDIRYIWRHTKSSNLLSKLEYSDDRILHSNDFMFLMTIPTETKTWKCFSKLFVDNPLMLFRLWELRDGMFATGKSMKDRIDQHALNVKWQVQRIYRIRNMIAHRGFANKNVTQLIGHLQSYFVTTVHDVFHTMTRRCLDTLDDIFESRRRDLEYLGHRLCNTSDKPVSAQFVASGYAGEDTDSPPMLWESI